jgi:crotonobetainyl-CoA:carnitine CoA-transferase CaiB-like acyl-CoA transferase
MGTYPSSDGHFNIGASGTTQFRALCECIGRLDLRDEPNYQKNPGRLKDRSYINEQLNKAFTQHNTEHWVSVLNAAGVPCGPIYNMKQVFDDPQVQHLQMTTTLQHPRKGSIRVVNQPLVLSRTPARVETTQCELGEHNHAILGELGLSAKDIEELSQRQVI